MNFQNMDEKKIKNIIQQISETGFEGISKEDLFFLNERMGSISDKDLFFLTSFISGAAASERDKALDAEKTKKTKKIEIMNRSFVCRMIMALITFGIGVFFLIISVIIGLTEKESLMAIVFGGIGITSIVSSLIFRPDKTVEGATRDMIQQTIALETWFQGFTQIAHSLEPEKTYGTYGEMAHLLLRQFRFIEPKRVDIKMLIDILEVGLGFKVRIQTAEQLESAIAKLMDLAVTCSSLIEGTKEQQRNHPKSEE